MCTSEQILAQTLKLSRASCQTLQATASPLARHVKVHHSRRDAGGMMTGHLASDRESFLEGNTRQHDNDLK